jgi:hypothetical protein
MITQGATDAGDPGALGQRPDLRHPRQQGIERTAQRLGLFTDLGPHAGTHRRPLLRIFFFTPARHDHEL